MRWRRAKNSRSRRTFAGKSRTTTGTRCPRCGVGRVIPIVYGFPGSELIERARRGEVSLGGCVIMPGQPHITECRVCHYGRDERPDVGFDWLFRPRENLDAEPDITPDSPAETPPDIEA